MNAFSREGIRFVGFPEVVIPHRAFVSRARGCHLLFPPGQILWEDGKTVGRAEGQPLDMKNFRNRVFLKACDRAKIRRRRVHDIRHSFASILLMNGESPAYVRDQLGHSSIKLTVDVYGHWIPGSNLQAVNKLPSLTAPKALTQVAGD